MDTRDLTCAERIDAELASRLADFGPLVERMQSDDDDDRDAAFQEHNEYPLSVEVVRSVRILLSTGGPHDEFICTVDDDGDIVRIEYKFQDWFDGASKFLEGDQFEQAKAFLYDYVEIAANNHKSHP